MPYVITQKCVEEIYAECIQVCPVDCIHFVEKIPEGYPDAGRAFMVIDPETCIDCGACEPECPIGAIVGSAEQDPKWADVNKKLTPQFLGKRSEPRGRTSPPRRSDNQLVN